MKHMMLSAELGNGTPECLERVQAALPQLRLATEWRGGGEAARAVCLTMAIASMPLAPKAVLPVRFDKSVEFSPRIRVLC